MMKEFFIAGIALVISGCSSYSSCYVKEKYGCEYGRYSLYQCAHSDAHPVVKVVYKHNGNSLQVFQVLKDGVLVTIAEPKPSYVYDNRWGLNIFVETSDEYVDNEFLRSGFYQYTGTYSYEAVNGSNRTVRRFKQLE